MEDELEQLLADGKISIESYNRLKNIQNSNTVLNTGPKFIDEYYGNIKRNLGTDPDLTPDSGTEYQLSLSPEELKTYTSRGINPSTLFDYEDARAQRQSTADKWGNGLTKFLGKTATATVGGIGMIGSIANNVAEQFEDGVMGLTGREGDTSFHQIYDNGFYRALDEANKEMDSAFPNYVTKAEQEYNLGQSLGTANFWANDFLQGASFVTAAILTEGLMSVGAGATGLKVLPKSLQRARELTGTSIADITTGGESLFARSATAQSGLEAATVARQIITGAGYESSVEAMSFVDDAKRQWLEEYKYDNGPDAEPTEQETAEAMGEIYGVANSVFGINLLVVGLTQAKTLPGMFAPNISSTKIGKLLGASKIDDDIYEGIVATKGLTNRELLRASKKLGKSVDEVKAIPSISKYDTMSTLGKIRKGIVRGGEGLVIEGGQEGLQKAINYAGLDFLNDRMDPNGIEDVLDSGLEGMSKAFGNNAESWKEIFIGALLGGIGGPSKTRGWEGGVIEGFRAPNKSPRFQSILDEVNKYTSNSDTIISNFVKQANLSSNVQRKKDRAEDKGDVQDYTTQEAKDAFGYFNAMSRLGRQDEIEDNVLEKLNTLSKKEFQERFGYANLTKNDFAKRKLEIADKIKKEIADTNDAMDKARSIYRGKDPDVLDTIGYTIYSTKNLDNREEILATTVSQLTGIIDPRTLIEISRDNQRLKLKDGWLTTYRDKVEEIKQDRDALQTALETNKAFEKTEQITNLEKKITAKEKELKKLLKQEYNKRKLLKKTPNEVEYELNFDEFEQKINKNIEFLTNVEKHYSDNAINAAEVKDKLAQLKTVAKTRERFIGDFNRLLTEEGVKELENQIEIIRGHYKKEQVDLETMLIMEAERAKNPALQTYKAQEAAFKLRGGSRGVEVEQEGTPENKIKALEEAIDNLPAGPGTDLLKAAAKQVIEKLNKKDISDIESFLDNIYAQIFNDESLNAPEYKDTLDTVRGIFNEIVAYVKAPKSKAAIDSISRFFKVYVPKELKKEIGTYLANTFIHPSEYEVKIEKLNPNDPYVKAQEAKNRISLLEDAGEESPEGEELQKPKKILTPFMGLQTLVKVNGEYYAIKLMHDNKFLGYILDPNRYKFRNPDTGLYEDFNKNSLAHLRLVNPAYVSNGAVTDEGKLFIEAYEKGKEMFSYFENAIKQNKTTITGPELSGQDDSIGFFNPANQFNKTINKEAGFILNELRNSPEIYNVIPLDDEEGIQVHEGVYVKAPVVQVNVAGSLDYYYFDKEGDTFVKVTYQEGIDKLNKILNINGNSSRFKVSQSGFIKLVVPNPLNNRFTSISVELPQVDVNENDSSFVEKFKDWMSTFAGITKDEWSEKYTDDKNKKEKGLYFPVNILGLNNTGDTIKVRIYPKAVADSGKQFLFVEIMVNGNIGSTILDSFGALGNIKNGKALVNKLNTQIKRITTKNSLGADVPLLPKGFQVTGFNYISNEEATGQDIKDIVNQGIPSLLVSRSIVFQPNNLTKPENNSTKPPTKKEDVEDDEETFTMSSFKSPLPGERFTFEDDNEDDDGETEEVKEESEETDTQDDELLGFTSDDEPPPFSIQQELSRYEETIGSRQENVDTLLPSWIPMREITELAQKFKNKGFTYGVFIDNAIYLARNAPKGVEYHEAFHAVFRALLTDLQISKVYSEAKTRYGIPTKEQIDNLKGLSDRYRNLNNEQLTNLWYEEKLADEFQDYMLKPVEPKSFIQKIFDKIKRFIDWAFGNKNYIDYLFEDIKNGVYRNAKQQKNQFYQKSTMAFKALAFEEDYNGQKRNRTLDSKTTSNILNKVLKRSFDLGKSGTVTNVDIQDIIKELKDSYYTESNFQPLYDKVKKDKRAKIQSANRLLSQIQNALGNPKNIAEITKEVKNLIQMYKIVDYTLEEDEDQDTQDLPTEWFAKEAYSIGGVGSLTKEMRKYLQFIPNPIDELDLGVDVDVNSQYVSYADSYELYNGIARILANRKAADIIKALYAQSRSNKQIKFFANQLFYDIAKDLKMTNITLEQVANLPLLTLAESTTFNMFVANFRKNKIDYVSITPDVENGRFKLFYSNANDIKSLQVNEWGNANLSNPIETAEQRRILDSIRTIFANAEAGQIYANISEEKFNQEVNTINDYLNELHIKVDMMYIKMSLFNALPNKLDLAAINADESNVFYNLNQTLEVYGDLTYLNAKLLRNMSTALRNDVSSIYERVDGDDRSGSIGTLESIAEANSYFDFTIIPTTFKNIEGKTIYSYIQPNYFVDVLNSFKDNAELVISSINSVDFEEGFNSFRTFLVDQNLESNDYLERHFYNALRHNPMLTSKDAMSFISNVNALLLDGSRVITMDAKLKELTYLSDDDGKTFQSLDPRGKILTYFFLYSTPEKGSSIGRNSVAKQVGDMTYVPYLPFQNEGKNGQYPVMMPKKQYYEAGKLVDDVYKKMFKIFELERSNLQAFFDSVKNDVTLPKVKGFSNFVVKTPEDAVFRDSFLQAVKTNDIKTILDAYKDPSLYSKLPRNLKFSHLDYLNSIGQLDDLIVSALNSTSYELDDKGRSSIDMLIDDLLKETLDLISSNKVKLITKIDDNKYTNVLLPKEFLFNNKEVNLQALKNFLINDYINSVSLMNMVLGDMTIAFKDAVDFPKRMAGMAAAGPSLGVDKTKLTIIKDVVKTINDNEKDSTDGQSHATQSWYEKKYLKTFKKWNNEIEAIYKKMRKCQKLSWSEKELLDTYGALANSRKIALFNYALYGKTSVNPVIRNEVSFVKKKNFKKVNDLVEKLYRTTNNNEYKAILKDLHNYYEPYAQTKDMHNLLNKMELSEVDIALHESAVKTVIYNTQSLDQESNFESIIMGDTFIREQVITDNMKSRIVDGTQLLQLIDSEQDEKTMVNLYGKDVSIGTIVAVFKNMKAYRVKQSYDALKKSYYEKGKPRYKALIKSFRESLLAMGTDPIMLELISQTENLDSPKFNFNMNRTMKSVEKMLYSYLSASLSHKVSGAKFTLLSDYSYKVIEDDNGKIITMDKYRENPEISHSEPRDLEVKWDDVKKCYYAECVISPQTAYRYGLKPGDEVAITNKKLLEYIATRIPTQEKSSMAYLRVVDYLPVEKGNSVILPFEIMYYSGADFDIDSLFAHGLDTYIKDKKEIAYGEYLEEDDENARLSAAFDEYYQENSNMKSVKADYDKFLDEDEVYTELIENAEYTEKQLQIASLENLYDLAYFTNTELPEYREEVENEFKTKGLTAAIRYIYANTNIKEITDEQIATAKQIAKSIKSRKQKALNAAMKRNNYLNTLEEFTSNNKLVSQVNSNYTEMKKGNFLAYRPITNAETNNYMMELKSVLVKNEGNKAASLRDVERDEADLLTKKLQEYDIKDSTKISHYVSLISKVKMSIANAVGGKNIGIAATGLIMAQYMMKNGIDIGDIGKASKLDWNSDKSPVNKDLSLWISLGVDNAKWQDAGRFNISSDMQSMIVIDSIINKDNKNYSAKHIMSLGLVPKIVDMLNQTSFSKDAFKTKEEQKGSVSKAVIFSPLNWKPTNVKWDDLTLEEILTTIAKIEKEGNKPEYDNFQQAAINKVIDLVQIADYTFNFTQVLSLIKGAKITTADNIRIFESLNNLGVKVVKNGDEYTLDNNDEYYFYKEKEPKKLLGVHPINFLDIIESDPFLKEEIITFYKIMEDSGMFLIGASDVGREIFESVSRNLKPKVKTDEAKTNKLIATINNTLAFKAMRNKNRLEGRNEIDPRVAFISESPKDITNYIKTFNELKNSKLLKDNFLLKNLKASYIEGKEGGALEGKTIHYVATNSRLNVSPNMKKKIADDMFNLFAGNVYNADGSLNENLSKKAKVFVATLLNQIYQKDAGMFINETLLPYVEPFFLTNYSASLDKVQQAIAGNETFEDIIGMSKEEFTKEFIESYTRNSTNLIDVRGNRIDYIHNNITKALIDEITSLEKKEEVEGADINDILTKLIAIRDAKGSNTTLEKNVYDLVSPFKFLNDRRTSFELTLSPKISKEDNTTFNFDRDRRLTLANLYRKALSKTGIVNPIYVIENGKRFQRLEFLDTIVITTPEDGANVKRVYKLRNVEKGKKALSPNPYLGWRATYDEVTIIGSKGFSNFFYSPAEATKIFAVDRYKPLVKKEIKQEVKPSVKPEAKKDDKVAAVSETLKNLYEFFDDNMEGLLNLLSINSFKDFSTNINENLKNLFDKIVSNGKMVDMKNIAKTEKVVQQGRGKTASYEAQGSKEFLKFAEAYEKSTLDDLITKCKGI
jgi:hypothetical protein